LIEEIFEKQQLKKQRELEMATAVQLDENSQDANLSLSAQKKKRTYNRVKPTIRAMMGSEEIKQLENLAEVSKYVSAMNSSANVSNGSSSIMDVHDEIGDLFDIACVKSAHHNNNKFTDDENSNDLSLEDILIKHNTEKEKTRPSRQTKSVAHLTKSDTDQSESDGDSSDSDDFDILFGNASNLASSKSNKSKNNTADGENTRILRSRVITKYN
jgi:hypothetical protein